MINLNVYLNQHRKHIIVGLVLLVLSLMAYSNSLHNDFVMDDYGLILQDPLLHNPNFLAYQFIPDVQKALKMGVEHNVSYYRPLAHIVPGIGYLLFGKETFGYHVMNLFLFYFSCLVMYAMFNVLLKNRDVAFMASTLYCVHPINGLMVNYITASVFAVQIIAMQSSLLTFELAGRRDNKIPLYVLSVFCFLISLLCHETAMAFPFYLVCYLFFVKKDTIKGIFLKALPYGCLMLVYFMFRMEHASLKLSVLDKIKLFDLTLWTYISTFTKLVVWYFYNLIFLSDIVMILATHVVRENVLFWNLIFFAALAGCAWVIKRYGKGDHKVFGLLWFMIGFLPVTLACFYQPTIGFLFEAHWLFFPSVGFFLLLAIGLTNLRKHVRSSLWWVVIVAIFSSLIYGSRHYNYMWSNEKRYCHYWLKTVPGFKSVMFYLASAYMREGDYLSAKEYYRKSVANEHSDWEIYTNIGLIDYYRGDVDAAIQSYKTALAVYPASAITTNNLGLAYLSKDLLDEAEQAFRRVIEINRFLLEPRLNLAIIYKRRGKLDEAIRLYEENLKITPSDENTLLNIVLAFAERQDDEKILTYGQQLFFQSKKPAVLIDLGGVFAQRNMIDLALACYNKARELDPQNPALYLELGKLYGNLGDMDQAIGLWERGSKMDPTDRQFEPLIQKARQLKKSQKRIKNR